MEFTSDECLTALQFGQISSLRDLIENLASKQSCVQILEGFIIWSAGILWLWSFGKEQVCLVYSPLEMAAIEICIPAANNNNLEKLEFWLTVSRIFVDVWAWMLVGKWKQSVRWGAWIFFGLTRIKASKPSFKATGNQQLRDCNCGFSKV